MNDNFTEAARAEGQARIAAMLEAAGASDDIRAWFPAGFEKGAEWARTRLAAQEPTDAEVGAAQKCLYERTLTWVPTVEVRAALSAARATRRDEENR